MLGGNDLDSIRSKSVDSGDLDSEDWESLDEQMFKDKLFSTRMFHCAHKIIWLNPDEGDHILMEDDCDNIRMFNLITSGNVTQWTFDNICFVFHHKTAIDSEYVIFWWMEILTGIKSVVYDCCPNSCITYTQRYQHLQACPLCHQPCFKPNGQLQHQFTYFPLIPHLKGFFQSEEMVNKMLYCSEFQCNEAQISDVFSSTHYQYLLWHCVVVDGKKLGHWHFSNPCNIALSLCTDSYLLYHQYQKGPCATPIVLQNYNLPPCCCTHITNLLCVGIIPGPHQPKDIAFFLSPLDDKLAELAHGVATLDATTKNMFQLHTYLLFKLGDIITVEKFLKIKGHNSIYPCQSCNIQAIQGDGQPYYVPLCPPENSHNAAKERVECDLENLPLHRHNDFIDSATRIATVTSKAAKEHIAKETGIKGLPGIR